MPEPARRDFELPPEDVQYLDDSGYEWEAVRDGRHMYVILRHFPLPAAYQPETTDVALLLPASYPTAQIDMAYFREAPRRRDGKEIPAVSRHVIQGGSWTRWSRHRTKANPWRPGVDGIETHLLLVREWLEREPRRRP